jgi:hypothetical protein
MKDVASFDENRSLPPAKAKLSSSSTALNNVDGSSLPSVGSGEHQKTVLKQHDPNSATVPYPTSSSNNVMTIASAEDQLVQLIRASPGQRIMKVRLLSVFREIYGSQFQWIDLGFNKCLSVLKRMPLVKLVVINKSKFIVEAASFDPVMDVPMIDRKAVEQLENEFVELLRSLPEQRIHPNKPLALAYFDKYRKPLQIEPTGYFVQVKLIRTLTRVAMSNSPGRKFMILAPLPPTNDNDVRANRPPISNL